MLGANRFGASWPPAVVQWILAKPALVLCRQPGFPWFQSSCLVMIAGSSATAAGEQGSGSCPVGRGKPGCRLALRSQSSAFPYRCLRTRRSGVCLQEKCNALGWSRVIICRSKIRRSWLWKQGPRRDTVVTGVSRLASPPSHPGACGMYCFTPPAAWLCWENRRASWHRQGLRIIAPQLLSNGHDASGGC